MKIEIDKQIVKFTPENEKEVQELNKLWQYVVACEGESFKLVPIGMFVPGTSKEAMFQTEGLKVETAQVTTPKKKIRYVCMECNRMEEFPEGEAPVCCGQPMHPMD
ncbi:hypothetical protein [Thermodesulfatator autotrophicus]|uniref:Uncharacterized protein n=1 Tax=Thermodesulfatator autotrophicus TaxID=1795632 RepID=A0A177E4G5_9BACT|nr:hypothetical protein [Thermodesulfatator autotrophicus]OAG26844.1 hypothetical protein TH606_10170 [Thermodesulfatator autotrophicus]